MSKPCIAVVSPFIDKRHGTERRVAEWVSRLTEHYEIHLYSQRVEDLDLSRMVWHRIPTLPGPHLANYLWWLVANHSWRWWDRRFGGLRPELVFTPGTNCLDADAISVHIVFAEFVRQTAAQLRWRQNPIFFWPRLLHRKLYYRLIVSLERHLYRNPRAQLILIARKTASDLKRFYNRDESFPVVYIGLDLERFNPERRFCARYGARKEFGLQEDAFVLLLIGNDWKKKGLVCLLDALHKLNEPQVILVVAGQDDSSPYQKRIRELSLEKIVRFLPLRADVERYYALADAYVGPSLEDTFAQPPAEAMACGLPVITSVTNGTAEIMSDGVDGLLVQDPKNSDELTSKIRLLLNDTGLRVRLGQAAARTAQNYTWDRNGREIFEILESARQRKRTATGR